MNKHKEYFDGLVLDVLSNFKYNNLVILALLYLCQILCHSSVTSLLDYILTASGFLVWLRRNQYNFTLSTFGSIEFDKN